MKPVPIHPPRHGKAASVEVAPGQSSAAIPASEVRRIGVCDLVPLGDGTYKAILRVKQEEVRLNPQILKELGLAVRVMTLRRLIRAGFVDGARVGPNGYNFSLQSYFDHVERVRAAAARGEEFWTTDNRARYRTAI